MTTNDIIKSNIYLVSQVLYGFKQNDPYIQEELFSAGLIGLWQAVINYEPSYKMPLSSFAKRKIKWMMINCITRMRDKNGLTYYEEPYYWTKNSFWEYVPHTLSSKEQKILNLKLDGCTIDEIAERLLISQSQVSKIYNKIIKKIRQANNGS